MAQNIEIIINAKDNFSGAFNTLGGRIVAVNQALQLTKMALRGIAAPLSGILEATDVFKRLQITLENLGDSTQKAGQTMQFLVDTAARTPFTLRSLTRAFQGLRATGIQNTQAALTSLIDATAAFGGSDEDFLSVALAVEQMAGRGVVAMEELRRQLGQRIPSAIRIMARELGVSMPELFKRVSAGAVDSFTGIQALIRGFNKDFAGSAERLVQTWGGATRVLSTQWTVFLAALGGVGDFYGTVLRSILGLAESLKNISVEVRNWQAHVVDAMVDIGNWIRENWALATSILAAAAAFAAFTIMPSIIRLVMGAVGLLLAVMTGPAGLAAAAAFVFTAWRANLWGMRDITVAVADIISATWEKMMLGLQALYTRLFRWLLESFLDLAEWALIPVGKLKWVYDALESVRNKTIELANAVNETDRRYTDALDKITNTEAYQAAVNVLEYMKTLSNDYLATWEGEAAMLKLIADMFNMPEAALRRILGMTDEWKRKLTEVDELTRTGMVGRKGFEQKQPTLGSPWPAFFEGLGGGAASGAGLGGLGNIIASLVSASKDFAKVALNLGRALGSLGIGLLVGLLAQAIAASPAAMAVLQRISATLMPLLAKIGDALVPVLESVAGFLEAISPSLKTLIEEMGPAMKDLAKLMKELTPLLAFIVAVLVPVIQYLILWFRLLVVAVRALAAALITSIAMMVGPLLLVAYGLRLLYDPLKRLWEVVWRLIQAINNFNPLSSGGGGQGYIPDWVPGIGGFHGGSDILKPSDLLRLPGMRSDEGVATLQTGERVLSRRDAQGGGPGITVIQQFQSGDPRIVEATTRRVLDRLLLERKLSFAP